ncbi:MAG: celM, partial [Verrucomicrobiaceae bacterium]|nr:celM [Verrucomicrobiaceae bacterium]
GASSNQEALEAVAIGDYATFPLKSTRLLNNMISAPGLDNKAGLYVCLEVLRRHAESNSDVALSVASCVQEEIGSRGSVTATSKVCPDVGLAIDVVPATDDPGFAVAPQNHPPCKLGGGPTISAGPNTNRLVRKLLLQSASRQSLDYQEYPWGKTAPNDSKSIQTEGGGVASGSVGIPQRNMHTPAEVVSLVDIESTIKLVLDFVRVAVDEQHDFRPYYFRPNGIA